MQSRKIRILVVDHNPLLREGLSLFVQLQPEMELVGTATQADEALQLFRAYQPDVTLMDLDLPNGGGVKVVYQIRAIVADAVVVGMLTYEWDKLREEAIRAGACGCVTKDRLNEELVPLIRRCLA